MQEAVYPMMAQVQGKPCLVIGGGKVAERKIGSLLEAGAKITVISPTCKQEVTDWVAAGRIEFLPESYDSAKHRAWMTQAMLVLAATDQPAVNRQIAADADALGRWVNVADAAELSSFLVPSTLRRGKLTIAVTTSGASPGIAARIRRELERDYGPAYKPYIELLEELRLLVKELVSDRESRQRMLRLMLEWELLPHIGTKRYDEIRERLLDEVRRQPTESQLESIGKWLAELERKA